MKTQTLIAIILMTFAGFANAQTTPFQVAIEPMEINQLGGLQAFAFGVHDGKWLVIGGRLDGLHRRQPWAAFDEAGHNNEVMVIDPVAKQKWSAPLSSLSVGMQEQLSSTNMEFQQDGDYLYMVGGYGYSTTAQDHITYDNLTAVKISATIDAVINGTSFTAHFRQISDPEFAVTGGYLNKVYDTFYLVGGQKFDGRYNPMGNNTFTQQYTDAIRKFNIHNDGNNLSVTHLPTQTDQANLHRRDFNVVPQIMPNGEEGLTAFSGVFQELVDLPFLNSVNIDSSGYTVNNVFQQYYNHYHCAHVPLYSVSNNEMHNLFFGGIAQFYDSSGTMVQDNDVPFVKTIARVSRNASGTMSEWKLPIEMPAFLGAGSEFIPIESIPQYSNEVMKLDEFTADSTLVGYIYGGISSTEPNIFFTNDGTQSSASSQIFKVYVIKNGPVNVHELNEQSTGSLQLNVFPNPSNGFFVVKFNLKTAATVNLTITDVNGKVIRNSTMKNLEAGDNYYTKRIKGLTSGGIYFLKIETPNDTVYQKIIVNL